MLQQIKLYIQTHELLSLEHPVIVGVSGGADSMALLDILSRLGYRCIVAHCNFHLRGKESLRDENFVFEHAVSNKFTFEKIDFNTTGFSEEHGISVEMAARQLRYEWFELLSEKYNTPYIAVAHHADDNMETFFLNLLRGTGLNGLTGMKPKNGKVVRPLLDVSRESIINYLTEQELKYVEDFTNKLDIYKRNNIRHHIIPAFEKMNPSFRKTMQRTMSYLDETYSFYADSVEKFKRQICSKEGNDFLISIDRLNKEKHSGVLLYEMLKEFGFENQVSEISLSLEKHSGKQFFNKDYVLLKDRDSLIIRSIKDSDIDNNIAIDVDADHIEYPLPLSFEKIPIEHLILEKDASIAFLDAEKLTYPLYLRRWKQGDVFYPFGMKSKKKLSDFFIDQKLNLYQKENCWILCSGENICWIAGLRIDNRYAVTSSTQEVLKIKIVKSKKK